MELSTEVVNPMTRLTGYQILTVTPPMNLKILTTGDTGVTLLNVGPTHGKSWSVNVWVRIDETDA